MIDPFRESSLTWERLASRRLLTHSIQHDGLNRRVLLYVPRHVRRRGGLPLVLMFHGGASNPETLAQISEMHRLAERAGFIVAYPAGTPGKSGLTWVPSGKGAARTAGDTRFVRNLIGDLRRRYDVDPARIYAAGFSIGGSLVYELASVFADTIAAVAVVSGTMTVSHADPTRPVPLIHIHGTKDRRVPFAGGRGPATAQSNEWLPVRACIDHWCRINGCLETPAVVRQGLTGITGYAYAGVAPVELWLVEGGGHAWPGGKRIATRDEDVPDAASGFSATEKIWSFFAAHPLGRRRQRQAPAADGPGSPAPGSG